MESKASAGSTQQSRLSSPSAGPSIPVVNLDDADRDRLVRDLRSACQDVGFFYLRGHGVDAKLLNDAFAQLKKLFALPSSVKRDLSDPVLSRGYTAMGEETLDPGKQSRGDTKEGYYISGDDVPTSSSKYNPSKLSGPNVWPTIHKMKQDHCEQDEGGHAGIIMSEEECAIFRSTMESYIDELCRVGFRVVRLLALAIGVEEDYFDESFLPKEEEDEEDESTTKKKKPAGLATLRLLHYSSEVSDVDSGVYACGAHSDYGMITLLATDDNPGLQILSTATSDNGTANSEWIDVPPLPNTFVVNLGDMLERWTNGKFRSTKHRVITPPRHRDLTSDAENNGDDDGQQQPQREDRYSIPFFYDPQFDTVVKCIDTCSSDENPPKYPPITSGQHLLDKYKQTHSDFKPQETP